MAGSGGYKVTWKGDYGGRGQDWSARRGGRVRVDLARASWWDLFVAIGYTFFPSTAHQASGVQNVSRIDRLTCICQGKYCCLCNIMPPALVDPTERIYGGSLQLVKRFGMQRRAFTKFLNLFCIHIVQYLDMNAAQ